MEFGVREWGQGLEFRVEASFSRGQPWKNFRQGLVFKAHRLMVHSTLGSKVVKKKEEGHYWEHFFDPNILGILCRV